MAAKPLIVAMDLEGCLVPEIWINVAERTGIKDLLLTTRDIPDYDELMRKRLQILDEHKLGMQQIVEVIDGLEPLTGARDYVEWVRDRAQLIILSDTFYEFARPLMVKLGNPTLFCHNLTVSDDDQITDYRLRVKDGKRGAVEGFRSNGFSVLAIGDSYNDTTMLAAADRGILFHAPSNVLAEFPQFSSVDQYSELQAAIEEALAAD